MGERAFGEKRPSRRHMIRTGLGQMPKLVLKNWNADLWLAIRRCCRAGLAEFNAGELPVQLPLGELLVTGMSVHVGSSQPARA